MLSIYAMTEAVIEIERLKHIVLKRLILLVIAVLVTGGCGDPEGPADTVVIPDVPFTPYSFEETKLVPGAIVNDCCIDSTGRLWIAGEFKSGSGIKTRCSYAIYSNGRVEYHPIYEVWESGDTIWRAGRSIDCSLSTNRILIFASNTRVYILPGVTRILTNDPFIWWSSKIFAMSNGNLVFVGWKNGVYRAVGDDVNVLPLTSTGDSYIDYSQKNEKRDIVSFILHETHVDSKLMQYDNTKGKVEEIVTASSLIKEGKLVPGSVFSAACYENDNSMIVAISTSPSDHRIYRVKGIGSSRRSLELLLKSSHYVRYLVVDEYGRLLFCGDKGMIGTYHGGKYALSQNIIEQRYKTIRKIVLRNGKCYAIEETGDGGFVLEGSIK